jgi:hypothetical protein
MKVLSNCSVTKLKEYGQSYGSPEITPVPYIKEFEKEIWLCNDCGEHYRTMKKGTKLLISYSGKEITQRQLKGRTNKAVLKRSADRQVYLAAEELKQQERQAIAAVQLQMWVKFLSENPESKEKYISKVNTMPSSKWRNYLKLKAARHINSESFHGLEISAPQLKEALFN